MSKNFQERITPACAGKTFQLSGIEVVTRDHPRVCGENIIDGCLHIEEMGSPPRVRGKPKTCSFFIGLVGITPACAGKTCQALPPGHQCWDHPRVCGENFINESNMYKLVGSPPRVRGKP